MWIFLLLMLLFPGMCGLSSAPRQFHVVKEDKTWTAAQQYCREKFTDLATIDNMAEMENIKRVIEDAGVGAGWSAWIGLKNGNSAKWQWSLADEGFYGENKAEFRNWKEAQDQQRVHNCVCMNRGGLWHDGLCTQLYNFMCYNGTNSTYPYVLVEDEKTWADAQRHCREKHRDLASVRNQAENDKIKDLTAVALRTGTQQLFWIGLFRDGWGWSDGSSSSFRYWAPKEPNTDSNHQSPICVEMMSSGYWNDHDCYVHRNVVCYEALPTVEVVSPQSPFYSGDVVTLNCDIPKYAGQHQYGWLKDSTPVPGKTSQTITITLPLEAGQYQCHRRRDSSSVAPYISMPFDIKYQDLPNATVVVVSPSLPFYSGDDVTLKCDIPEHSDWHRYVWIKNNNTVPDKTNQTITITLPLEVGRYQCSGERNNRPMTSSVSSSVDIISNAHVKRTQEVRVEMEASDDVDMEDPDVQKAFLQQIRDRLKAKGFRGNVKLSWMKQPDGKVFHQKKNDKKKEKRDEL